MLDKAGALPDILSRVKKLPIGNGLDLRTYKRDRSVTVIRLAEDAYEVRENGFEKGVHTIDFKGLKRLLKTLLKREFPRSRKIRLQTLPTVKGRREGHEN